MYDPQVAIVPPDHELTSAIVSLLACVACQQCSVCSAGYCSSECQAADTEAGTAHSVLCSPAVSVGRALSARSAEDTATSPQRFPLLAMRMLATSLVDETRAQLTVSTVSKLQGVAGGECGGVMFAAYKAPSC